MKRKATTQRERATVHQVKLLNKEATNLSQLRNSMATLSILTSVMQPPITLANNISLQDFLSVRNNFEHVGGAHHLSLHEGTVAIHELFRGAHETIVHILADKVKANTTAIMGALSLTNLGQSDIIYGNSLVQPDLSFRPRPGTPGSTATLLIQVLDSTFLRTEVTRSQAILAAPNEVQGILLVKLYRFLRIAVPAQAGVVPRTVGDHTFNDAGFLGDPAPVGAREITPVSEIAFIYLRRGVAQPTIIRTGLGVPPAGVVFDNRNVIGLVFPGIPIGGACPGPFAANSPIHSIIIPWADLFFVAAGGVPLPAGRGVAAVLAAPAGPGLVIDPFEIWQELEHDQRYRN